MRIALYHHLPTGGALLHLCDLARILSGAGHEIDLFLPSTAERDFGGLPGLVARTVEVPYPGLPSSPLLPNPLGYVLHLLRLARAEALLGARIRAGGYQGALLGQCRHWAEPPLLRFLGDGLPSVLVCAEPKRIFYDANFREAAGRWPLAKRLWRWPTLAWMRREERRNIDCARLVLCNSGFSRDNIARVYPGVEAVVNRIGVDTGLFSPPETPPRPGVICGVGAFDPVKNHRMAIRIAAAMPAGIRPRVDLAGDREVGDRVAFLRRLAGELGVQVDIRQRISREELVEHYRRAFACVYCPFMEPFGMVATEAQACGTPVLGRDEGGLRETIPDGQRFLDDPAPYAALLQRWISRPEEYARARADARRRMVDGWDLRDTLRASLARMEAVFRG